ncbi:MAG TPA: hypothetical protein PLP29_19905 [Candidatus Ozemobacteraceae bacterium]|nr:hypothetical protein [Candidatus Ozemobacteraceae bacterium]
MNTRILRTLRHGAGALLALCLLWPFGAARAADLPVVASVTVDFERQMLTCWGLAGQPWQETTSYEEEKARAWMDAMHHAYAAVLDVPLMEGLTVRSAIAANDALKERLGQVLMETDPVFYDPDVTGLVRCRMELPFAGKMSLRSALYLAALRPRPQEPKAFLASWTIVASATLQAAETASGSVEAARRVIIDLRRTGFEPSLFPRFFSETGELLFQEAQIPGPERFSRPVVRFTEKIEEAAHGFEAGQVIYVEAMLAPLSRRDVRIMHAEVPAFLAFGRLLTGEPLGGRDIVIVHGSRPAPSGVLPKTGKKDKDGGKASGAKKKR